MTKHQYKADAVVIGGGLAGIAAAIELLDHGKSVVLLERGAEEDFGGLAKSSFGGIFLVGSPEQRRAGIRDYPDLALADWVRFGELSADDEWPRRWAEAYVNQCTESVYRWLRARHVKFFPVVNWVERGLSGEGNSVPRFHIVWGTGQGLIGALLDHLDGHPHRSRLTIHFGHRVTELSRSRGAYSQCSGIRENDQSDFLAEGDCLIVAAGGIAGNHDLVRHWWDESLGTPPDHLLNGSSPFADGRMMELVSAGGGAVTHLNRMWNYAAGVHHWKPKHENHGLSLVPPKSALWVNYTGRRLGPPAMVTGFDTLYLVQEVCKQEKKYSWQIMNWKIAKKELAVSGSEFNRAVRDRKLLSFLFTVLAGNSSLVSEFVENCQDFVTADSISELTDKMNLLTGTGDVDVRTLTDEIRRYDEEIRRGPSFYNDDQLRRIAHARRYRGDRVRTCKPAPIDDRKALPLIAVREHILTRKSLGGIQTDLSSRVLGVDGARLPGLYAIGEAAGFGGGGIHGLRSLEGTFLGGCIFSGRLAGKAIAKGQ